MQRGVTVPFDQLPPRSIALDGYVQGPAIDPQHQRYSFDHHGGCIRHATLASCEMALDAVDVGLDPTGMLLCLNDLDADSVLSAWILLRPAAAAEPRVASAIRALGRLDALGPASRGPGLVPALRWALQPLLQAELAGTVRTLDDTAYRGLLDQCLERLDRWWAAGGPHDDPRFPPPPPPPVPLIEILYQGTDWVLATTPAGLSGFRQLYQRGLRAAVLARPLPDGTTEYTLGKASEFVTGFDVPRLLQRLALAELRQNPSQDPGHTWGGGSTIGGSPRNPDGSSSRLSWEQVVAVIEEALGETPDPAR